MLVFRLGIHKKLVRIANSEEPDQTASFLIWVSVILLPAHPASFGHNFVLGCKVFI